MLFECRICHTHWYNLDLFLRHWQRAHWRLVRDLFEMSDKQERYNKRAERKEHYQKGENGVIAT